jgi:hypothetical protein
MSVGRAHSAPVLLLGLRADPLLLLAQLGRELGAEVVDVEHLPDLDLERLAGGGRNLLDPLEDLVLRGRLEDPVAGVERPSASKRTRAPAELGCSPSPASMMPAFTSSSLYFPIAASSSVLGITPASESAFALTMTMKRMSGSPSSRGGRSAPSQSATNGRTPFSTR